MVKPPRLTAKQISLKAAHELFEKPPTDEVTQAEAVMLLHGRYKLTFAEVAAVLKLTPRQVNTRKKQYAKFSIEGKIPTGNVPAYTVTENPHEAVLLDVVESRRRSKVTAETKKEANSELFLTALATACADLVPAKADFSWIEKAHRSYGVPTSRKKDEEVAMAILSDLHLHLKTPHHDFARGMRANDNYFRKVLRLTELHRQNFNVRKIVINFNGDMIQGTSNYGAQRWDVDVSAAEQCRSMAAMCIKDIELALTNFDEVEVVISRGNHGYMTAKKLSVDPATHNWETIAGWMVQQAFRGHKRVKVTVPEDWYHVLDVMGIKFLTTHGHDILGSGDYASIVKQIGGWHSVTEDYDYVILGHFHRCADFPLPTRVGATLQRRVYLSGTAVTHDDFLQRMGSSPTAQWWLLFVDPKGITAEHKVYLYGRG